ncbi:MAG: hypothetical protein M1820_009190 [Bogoriella megaspora]|nr:MAG: hypothetical protein M1820_009190 [Bogoriella megaspora]
MDEERTYEWFTKENSKSRLFHSVQKLNEERNEWNLKGLSIPEEKGGPSIMLVARDPAVLYTTTKQEVEEQIRKLVDDDADASIQSKAESKLYLTSKAFKDWKSDRRSNNTRKAGAGLQNVLCTMADFLQSFSGIAEMVKAADQQYGGLAYGTISLLVSVAAHKRQREEAIEDALEELAYAFPRLSTLKKVRPKDSLRALIAEVFELTILFCRETIQYFAKRIRRLTNAFSPKELKMKTVSRLRTKLSEIHRECEVMMLEELADTRKQLYDVQRQLREIQIVGDDTNIRIREGESTMRKSNLRADETYLSELKRLLGLKRPEDVQSLKTITHYKSILAKEISSRRQKRKSPRPMSWTLLIEQRVFSDWLEQPNSAMLLLGGSNWSDDSSVQLNWLSDASLLVAESTKGQSARVLFMFCQTDYTAPKRKRRYFSEIVRNLIYQLAEQHPDHLRSHQQEMIDALESSKWRDEDSTVAFETMAQLLINLMAVFDKGTEFTIVIDRLDQCRWSEDPNNEANDLDKAVRSLFDFITHPSLKHLRIKLLLVMDERPAEKMTKIMKWDKDKGLDWKVDWDQESDEDSEE